MVSVAPPDRAQQSDQPSGRRLRVAHVTATFPPYLGGTGNVAYHNALELARRGHQVRVVTAGGPSEPGVDPPGVIVQRLPAAFRIGNAPLAPGLSQALAGQDLVHLHYPFYFGGEQTWWACHRAGIPYVVTYHQDVIFRGPMALAARIHHALLGERLLRGARLVAATTLDYAAHSRLRRLPPGLLTELPNGVDAERFRPDLDGQSLRARYGLVDGQPLLLFVGALDQAHYFKGVPILLAALAGLAGVALLVVGAGDLRAEYQRQAVALGLGERVHFAGHVADAELPLHYALADLTVLPSTTLGEAFGLVLLESLACGTPVVASRLPGVRSVVNDGVTGLLARLGDPTELRQHIATLLADPAHARAMGAAGRRAVEQRYAWPRIGQRLEALYAAALASITRPAPVGAAA